MEQSDYLLVAAFGIAVGYILGVLACKRACAKAVAKAESRFNDLKTLSRDQQKLNEEAVQLARDNLEGWRRTLNSLIEFVAEVEKFQVNLVTPYYERVLDEVRKVNEVNAGSSATEKEG